MEHACLWTGEVASPFSLKGNHRNDFHEHVLAGILSSDLRDFAAGSVAIQFTPEN